MYVDQRELAERVVVLSSALIPHRYHVYADGLDVATLTEQAGIWAIKMSSPVEHSPMNAKTIGEALEAALVIANVFCAKGAFERR